MIHQSPEEHQRRLAEQQAACRRAAEAQRREEAKRKAEEDAKRREAAKPQQDKATIEAKAAEARKRFRARIEAHEAELRFKAEQAEQAQQHEALAPKVTAASDEASVIVQSSNLASTALSEHIAHPPNPAPYQKTDLGHIKAQALLRKKQQQQQARLKELQQNGQPIALGAGLFSPAVLSNLNLYSVPLAPQSPFNILHQVPSTTVPPSQSAVLASANVKPSETNPKPLTLEQQFEHNTAQKAQSLIQANKARLTSEQTQYLQDKNPHSERWKALWQAAEQKRAFAQQQENAQTNYDYANEQVQRLVEPPNDFNPLSPVEQQKKNAAEKDSLLQSYKRIRETCKARIEFARQQQVSLQYAYPALAAVQGEFGTSQGDIQAVQARLPRTFDGMRTQMDQLSDTLTRDPSTALMFDSVVKAQLQDKSLSSQQRSELTHSVKSAREGKQNAQTLGALASGGLFLASFIPALQEVAIPLRLAGVGGGAALSLSELPDLMVLEQATQAGHGGHRLTGESPEQAKLNVMMGYTNMALAVLDVGAETKVAQRLGPVAIDLAKSGVQVSRQKWSQVMGWVKQGPAGIEQTRAWLASVKGVTREMADRAMDAISPVEVAGVGRVSRAEVRGTAEGTTEQAVNQAKARAGNAPAQTKVTKPTAMQRIAAMSEERALEVARRLEKIDSGHSLDRHGADVSLGDLDKRLKTGIAPDGVVSFAPASTRFNSNKNWLLTRQEAIDTVKARYRNLVGDDLRKPPSSDGRRDIDINLKYDKPIDDGFIPDPTSKRTVEIPVNPATGKSASSTSETVLKKGKIFDRTKLVEDVTGVFTKFVWNESEGRWKIIQHYPLTKGWNNVEKNYSNSLIFDSEVILPQSTRE